MQVTTIGIIGCGVISNSYLTGAARSKILTVKGVADMRREAAEARAAEYGCQAMTVEELLADPDIEIVINLTIPNAHAEIDRRIIEAGKHVYSEKPLVASLADAQPVLDAAEATGLRVGCAPDTFLGASHQAVRRAIDDGLIGKVIGGSVCVATRGMEHWHPDPRFFYKLGGGPHLDIGPYYITQLINLLGPVASVSAMATKGFETRTITSEALNGTQFEVEVPTTINGSLLFKSGANLAITTSWDVMSTRRPGIEIYGTEGSLQNPDPNFFGGVPEVAVGGAPWTALPIEQFAFGTNNRTTRVGREVADYRIIGLIDMAAAIREKRDHRANGKLALHVLEVLDALEQSSRTGTHVKIGNLCEQPLPVPQGEDESVFLG